MIRHITDRQHAGLLSGLLPKREIERVRRHCASCAECRARHERLAALITRSENGALRPSPGLVKRILATHRSIARQSYTPSFQSLTMRLRPHIKKPAFALAAAVVVCVMTVMYVLYTSYQDQRIIPIKFSFIKGKAFLNNQEVTLHTQITEDSELKVPRNSAVVLAYNNTFVIKIKGESILEIQKSLSEDKNRREFVFNLRKGSLFTRLDNGAGKSNYFYLTPTAHIKSSRTEFILKVAENKTIVIPRSGTLRIRSLESEEEVISLPFKKYIITSTIETNDTDDYDDFNTDVLNNIDNPFSTDELRQPKDLWDTSGNI